MKQKHLPNREIVLTPETDFFGHIDKGDAIVSFFKSNIDDLTDTNMFALYGKWGSGKSTLMKYVGQELEKHNYKSIFFPAWEFEKDDNLSLSLLHYITDETGATEEKIVKEILQDAFDVLKSVSKSISFDMAGFRISGKDMIAAGEEYDKTRETQLNSSLYTKTKNFKTKFKEAEKAIIKKSESKKIIVFIDDLDRCEPENVLALLSSIKLFFTLSSDIIFFFGCDREAISKAVKHKYGEIIKADEYLEKVIDISFNMPQEISITKLLEHYFVNKISPDEKKINYSIELAKFFQIIKFTNPRHLKKVLTKFEIIRNFKTKDPLPFYQKHLTPNIIIDDEGDLMETIFTLFYIILYEFHSKAFNDLEDIDKKIASYTNAMLSFYQQKKGSNNPSTDFSEMFSKITNTSTGLFSNEFSTITLKTISNMVLNSKKLAPAHNWAFNSVLCLFLPINITVLDHSAKEEQFVKQFLNPDNDSGEMICINFSTYLINRKEWVSNMNSEYKLINFFQMCKILL